MDFEPQILNALAELDGEATGAVLAQWILGSETRYTKLRKSLAALEIKKQIYQKIGKKGEMPTWKLSNFKPNFSSSAAASGQTTEETNNSPLDLTNIDTLKRWVFNIFLDDKIHEWNELLTEVGGKSHKSKLKKAIKELVNLYVLASVSGINAKGKKVKAWQHVSRAKYRGGTK